MSTQSKTSKILILLLSHLFVAASAIAIYVIAGPVTNSFNNPPLAASNCYHKTYPDYPGIPLDYAKKLVSDYRDHHWIAINSHCSSFAPPISCDSMDSRSAWFDLDTLKRFIYTIESLTCAQTGNTYNLGIRIYFGEYPSDATASATLDQFGLPHNYAGLHTLLMVPTFQYPEKNNPAELLNIDFDPRKGIDPSNVSKYFSGDPNVLFLTPTSPSDKALVKNRAGLIPPPFKFSCDDYWAAGASFMQIVDNGNGFNGIRGSSGIGSNTCPLIKEQ